MRGDAVLGGAVHVPGANLHLQRLAFRTDHGGVQGLVDTETRLGDVVLESSRHRLPQGVHHAHRGVTVTNLVAQDTHTHQVVNVIEVAALDDHLLVDRPVMLGAPLHGGADSRTIKSRNDFGAYLGQIGIT